MGCGRAGALMSARPVIANLLLLGYPLLVHTAIVTGSVLLLFAALVLLGCNILAPWVVQGRTWAWVMLLVVVMLSLLFVAQGESHLPLYAAPVLIALAMLWFFARTLLPGRVPMITRFATAIRGPLPEPVSRYTRRVTQLWVVAFAGMALANILLAVFAPPVVWSLFTNFINYLLIGGLFVAEWFYRGWVLRDYESMTWREYMQALLQLDYRRLLV